MLHLVLCFVVGLAILSRRAVAVDGDPVAISGPYITELQVSNWSMLITSYYHITHYVCCLS